ncbi:MAG: hypothetical protein M3313_15595 [Actinomycetota bacterium]|nr:hypothetical protein [Actinomycetota bacterium]
MVATRRALARRRAQVRAGHHECGSAIIEFVFISVLVFLPLTYLVVGFGAVQRGIFAATEAAREAGRAIGTAPDAELGMARAQRAAELAVEAQSVDLQDMSVGYAPAGTGCEAAGSYIPGLFPGEEFIVCVTVTVRVPLLPEFIESNTATGLFVVERDRYAA